MRDTKKHYSKPWKRSERDTREERDIGYGRVQDHLNGKKVEFFWNLSPDAIRNQMFRLKVGKEEVILDAEEVMKYLRWV